MPDFIEVGAFNLRHIEKPAVQPTRQPGKVSFGIDWKPPSFSACTVEHGDHLQKHHALLDVF